MKLQANFCPEAASNEVQKCLQVHREFINKALVEKELKKSAGFERWYFLPGKKFKH